MPAIPAVIMAGASIGSAVIGSHAAGKASKTQAEAAATVGPMVQAAADQANAGITTAMGGVTAAGDKAQTMYSPYVNAGQTTLAQILSGIAPGGSLTKPFTGADMEAYDPGYQFRLDQNQQVIERSAAAKGTSLTGGTLKELSQFEQGLASSEYQNAFNRYMAQNQQTYSMLSGVTNLGLSATGASAGIGMNVAGTGLNAAEAKGGNIMNAAAITGNAAVGVANAQSAGTIGQANAWSQGLTGVANAAQQYYTMDQLNSGKIDMGKGPIPAPSPAAYDYPMVLPPAPVVSDPWKSGYIPIGQAQLGRG